MLDGRSARRLWSALAAIWLVVSPVELLRPEGENMGAGSKPGRCTPVWRCARTSAARRIARCSMQFLRPGHPIQRRSRDVQRPVLSLPQATSSRRRNENFFRWFRSRWRMGRIAGVQAQTYPSRSVTIIVPFPPADRPTPSRASWPSRCGRCSASRSSSRCRRRQRQHRRRSPRARGGRRLHHRYRPVGHPCRQHELSLDLRFEKDSSRWADLHQSAAAWSQKACRRTTSRVSSLDQGHPGKATFATRTGRAGDRNPVQQATAPRSSSSYRGAGPAMQDLISGESTCWSCRPLPRCRRCGPDDQVHRQPSPRRSPAIPDIPTSDEGGVPGLYVSGWFGFFAPTGTPKDVIARLNGAMVEALSDPAARARFADSAWMLLPRAADSGRTRRLPQGGDREVVAIIRAAGTRPMITQAPAKPIRVYGYEFQLAQLEALELAGCGARQVRTHVDPARIFPWSGAILHVHLQRFQQRFVGRVAVLAAR